MFLLPSFARRPVSAATLGAVAGYAASFPVSGLLGVTRDAPFLAVVGALIATGGALGMWLGRRRSRAARRAPRPPVPPAA